jgi:hypothetical protein
VSADFPDPEVEESKPRRSRARERQRRRRERQQSRSTQTPARSFAHLVPADAANIKLPTIRIPFARLLIGAVAGLVLVAVVIFLLGRLKPPDTMAQPHALWIGTEWTYETHEDDTVTGLVEQLQGSQIGTVFAWVSWLQEDATWRGAENFGAVRQFAEKFKAAYPNVNLYGWVSFPTNLGENGYRLDDEELQQNIADFSANVVNELGYDGVFLNVEPVWDGDENFLDLLRKVRASVGPDVPVSVAIPPDWSPEDADIPVPPLIVPGTVWANDYKKSVALLSDQMVLMAYNSGLSSVDDYAAWMAYQVQVYAEALNELGEGTELLIGIPTYDAEPPGHDPLVENVDSALQGIAAGLQQVEEAASYVRGVAIYAGWTTDELEWAQFNNWLASQ